MLFFVSVDIFSTITFKLKIKKKLQHIEKLLKNPFKIYDAKDRRTEIQTYKKKDTHDEIELKLITPLLTSWI